MTKRTYIIIIALLVALDVATGFWYVTGHINKDGKSDFFDGARDLVEVADTIPDTSLPDKYETTESSAFFVSVNSAVEGDNQTYYASIKRVKCKLPTEINGSKDLATLKGAIADKAFRGSHANLQGGIQGFLKTPVFNASDVDYKSLSTTPSIMTKYGNVQGVKIYPVFTSRNILVMEIDQTSYDGYKTRERNYFVNYSRRNHAVLTVANIFNTNAVEAVLKVVNAKIESLADDGGMPLHKATRLSSELCLRKKGIFFVFQPGEIANEGEGTIEILIPYKSLKKHLTPSVQSLVSDNADFKNPKPIAFKRG